MRTQTQRRGTLIVLLMVLGLIIALAGSYGSAAAQPIDDRGMFRATSNNPGMSPVAAPSDTFVYTVQPGDTLSKIAETHDLTVARIVAANPEIDDPNLIYAGQELVIPRGPAEPSVRVRPDNGPAGTRVQVTARDFPPETALVVSMGEEGSEFQVDSKGRTDASGELVTQVQIPASAEANERWAAVVRPVEEADDAAFQASSGDFVVTDQEGQAVFRAVDVYLVSLADRGESGEPIGCNDSLVPVEIPVEPTRSPAQAALQKLLSLENRVHPETGLYNALHRSDLALQDLEIAEDGDARVTLAGDLQLGGVCDEPRLMAQLQRTIEQFYVVDDARLQLEDDPLIDPQETIAYTVRDGDTLSHIAASFETTVQVLLDRNLVIEDPNRILVGQTVLIPRQQEREAALIVSPTTGPSGSHIRARARGLPPETVVKVGVGREDSEFDVISEARTDGQGELEIRVTIPEYAESGERWVVVLALNGFERKVISNVFIVD